jgi:hypothetical protein
MEGHISWFLNFRGWEKCVKNEFVHIFYILCYQFTVVHSFYYGIILAILWLMPVCLCVCTFLLHWYISVWEAVLK